jgi:hypothetical protein
MKTIKKILLLGKVFIFANSFAQIGINTPSPLAALDVNGNLKVRTVPETSNITGHHLLTVKLSDNEVNRVNPDIFFPSSNTSLSKARSSAGVYLLAIGISLFDTSWYMMRFDNTAINASNFTSSASDFYYTVPTTGKYVIDLNFKHSTLLSLGIATNAQIGIIRTPVSGPTTLVDSKYMNVVGLALVANYYFETINSVYELEAGDKIRFIYNRGALALGLGLLSNSSGGTYIYKVSN